MSIFKHDDHKTHASHAPPAHKEASSQENLEVPKTVASPVTGPDLDAKSNNSSDNETPEELDKRLKDEQHQKEVNPGGRVYGGTPH
jgi:hypothetical protein